MKKTSNVEVTLHIFVNTNKGGRSKFLHKPIDILTEKRHRYLLEMRLDVTQTMLWQKGLFCYQRPLAWDITFNVLVVRLRTARTDTEVSEFCT